MDTDELKFSCAECDTALIEDVSPFCWTASDNDLLCIDCSGICQNCQEYESARHGSWCSVSGENWCRSCTEDNAYYCDHCDEWNSDYVNHAADTDYSYCESCTYSNLIWCDGCDQYTADGCEDCLTDDDGSRIIHDYSYKPDPIFHSLDTDSRLFFGLEIETEASRSGSSRNECAEYAYRLEQNEYAYLKQDGSIGNGFEIVTHPMTHDYFNSTRADEFWETLEELRNTHKMRAWSASNCGVHIHISRSGFSGGAHQHRFLNLVYSNREFFTRIAGRESDQWAKFDDVMAWKRHDDGSSTVFKALRRKLDPQIHSDRYSAVNTNNRNTLEMRIFRSTLNQHTLKACLDLAHASVEYTRNLTVRDVNNGAMERINLISYIHSQPIKYHELISKMDRVFTSNESE